MSCFRAASPTDERIDDILRTTQAVLDVGKDALNLAPIQGLTVAASVLSTVVGMVLQARGNEQTRLELAENINSLAKLIGNTVSRVQKTAEEPSEDLQRSQARNRLETSDELNERVSALQKTLQEIEQESTKLSKGPFILRCLQSNRDAEVLVGLKERVKDAQTSFSVQGQITIEMLINGISGKMEKVVAIIEAFEQNQKLNKDELILERLMPVDAGYRSALNATKSRFFQGTRTEMLTELENWARGHDPDMQELPMYVLSGEAGTGKSTIAYEVARRLEKDKLLGASFFFIRGAENLSTTRFLLPTLAYQLARNQPDLYPHIVEAANRHLQLGKQQQLEFELDDLVIKPLMEVTPAHPPVIIIIDAIDECTRSAQDEVARLLHLFIQRLHDIPFPLRILVTTRPEIHIEVALQSIEFRNGAKSFKLHEIHRGIVDNDIRRFLEDSIIQLGSHGKQLLSARPDAITDLTKQADGLFIYASTAVDFLSREPDYAIENLDVLVSDSDVSTDEIRTLSQLDKLYVTILNESFPQDILDRPNVKTWIQTALGSIALLGDQLSLRTLQSLLGVAIDHIKSILVRLRSVILVSDDPDTEIRPIHATFPQFLTDKNRCRLPTFYIDPAIHHGNLAYACLSTLNDPKYLRQNVCRIEDRPKFKNEIADLQERIQKFIPLHVQYACVHWAMHLSNTPPTSELFDLMDKFFSTRLFVWLEALSILDRLDIAASALLHVRTWYEHQTNAGDSINKDTQLLINDGYRFVLDNFVPIDASVDHLYISALPLTPSCRLVDVYGPAIHGAGVPPVRVTTDRDTCWGPCLRAVEGHTGRVSSARFSQDGQLIVSAAWDRTVRTWDAGSGTPLNTLKGHGDTVETAVFSPDGRQIVSGSSDTTMRIWDTASGATLHKMRVKHGNVFAVAYSPDGKRIVSGSYNNALHMWDASSGKKLAIVDGVSCVNSVAFSRNGSLVVTASSDNQVRVWNAENGDMVAMLQGHTDQAKDAAFMLDGTKVVSGASDQTVRIWDLNSEKCLKILKGHTGRVFCVAVSPKADLIASGAGDSDRTIRLWNANTGDLVDILKDHTSWILSLDFSADGGRLVSASDDTTVRIWDVGRREARTTVGHDSEITCVVFSNDDKLVATGSDDQTVIVWEVETGKRMQLLKGHTQRIQSVAFSADNRRVVSAGWDNEIRIHDIESGKVWRSLLGHTKGVEAVACSPDGKLIASGANNLEPSVRLWDASTGEMTKKIRVDFKGEPIDMIKHLEFSPDSSKIYAETINELIYIWDCSTGQVLDHSVHGWPLEASKSLYDVSEGWLFSKKTGRKLCWLRGSKRGVFAFRGNYCAAGAGSGQFTILDLSELGD